MLTASQPGSALAAPLPERVVLELTPEQRSRLAPLLAAVKVDALDADAQETRRAYLGELARWTDWLEQLNVRDPIAALASDELLLSFLKERALSCRPATVLRSLAALSRLARETKMDRPTDRPVVRRWVRGFRKNSDLSQRGASPLLADQLRLVMEQFAVQPHNQTDAAWWLLGVRDRALLLFGWLGALRRRELAAIRACDVYVEHAGLRLVLPWAKGARSGAPQEVGVRRGAKPLLCPVYAWQQYKALIEHVGLHAEQPIFRQITRGGTFGEPLGDGAIARMVKKRVAAAGIDVEDFSAHSLRRGMVTEANRRGVQLLDLQRHGRWKSVRMVSTYAAQDELLGDRNPTTGLL